jgi:hypothetical protein
VSDYGEHVVSDIRLARLEERMRLAWWRLPADARFLTYIQDGYEDERGLHAPKAVFMVMSPDPKHPGMRTMTSGTALLSDWESAEREFSHFAGKEDPLTTVFRPIVREHVKVIQNLREML